MPRPRKPKNHWYAYVTARARGITPSWEACEAKVKGRPARYKGFPDRASAERWLAEGARYDESDKAPRFYAYRVGDEQGVVESWSACEREVRGRPQARYRGFPDRAAAAAWLAAGAPHRDRALDKQEALEALPEDAVFFDSGTGPGRGAEVNVTDRAGVPVAHLAESEEGELTPQGTLVLGRRRTNNYGELYACLLALRAAARLGSRHVYGDSRLVLDYWSHGHVSTEKRASDPDLAALAGRTREARTAFERSGGTLAHVPGGLNPADLGFHRD
ncbi:MAG: RNase H1/viroplasmin domain-containing protein [Deltaproteobacteria bacterium]|nr:RNase H1/viroplasmin domain-containing protein [Deltaproteobacteria bacterium]